jgi:protease IV
MANQQQKTVPPAPPYQLQRSKSTWWIPVVSIFATFAFIIIGIIIVIIILASSFEKEPYYVKNNSVLNITITGDLQERENDSPFNFNSLQNNYTYSELLHAIRNAKDDKRIKGIFIKGGMTGIGFAKAEEIRDAIIQFKNSGKFVYSYMDWGSEIDYYIASTADKIYMPREGMIELNGFAVTAMFYKELFDKIGIDYYVLGFEDFKSAGESYNRKNFSDSARYEYRVLLDQRYNNFVTAVSNARGLEKQFVINAVNRGIYSTDSLLSLGFIDSLIFEEDLKMMIKKQIFSSIKNDKELKEKKYTLVSVSNYLKDIPEINNEKMIADKDKQIAVIFASGPLVPDIQADFSDELVITANEMIEALKKARENDDIKVIILRIDSPGGSVLTSDEIYEEILKTTKVKPVYASMSDVAASGGYYIAAPCDTIIAHPSTITGSIGVILAIPNVSRLMDNIYLSVDTITTGPAATQLSGVIPFSKDEKEKVKVIAKNIYDRFLNKVAKHRNKTYDEVRALAKGRVWTGEDAKEKGLVDVLGGYDKAISLAKKRMGLSDSMIVHVQIFPKKKDKFQEILKLFGFSDDGDTDVRYDYNSIIQKTLGLDTKNYLPVYNSLPDEVKEQINYIVTLLKLSEKENVLMTLPEKVNIQ